MTKLIKIAVLENQIEAQLLEGILNERNINHNIESYHDIAYDGLFQQTKGWGCIKALEGDQDSILSILKELRKKANKI